MSGRFCASFDTETTIANLVLGKWNSCNTPAQFSFASGNNGQCLRIAMLSGSGGILTLIKNFGTAIASPAEIFMKVHFRASILPGAGPGQEIFSIMDSGQVQVCVVLNPDGSLTVYRQTRSAGHVLGTSSGAITAGTFYSISLGAVIHGSTGSIMLKIGSTTVLTLTNQNTSGTGNNSANGICLGSTSNGIAVMNLDYDDLVVNDSAGSINNGFPDQGTLVGFKLASAPGSSTQFTPLSGSNFANVNEANPDGDTSYVADGNVGDKDLYVMTPCPANTGPIGFIQMNGYVRIDVAGSRSHSNTLKSGATSQDGTSTALTATYACVSDIVELDPNTAAQWTKSGLDGTQFGPKVSA